jgi:hypothetical protein
MTPARYRDPTFEAVARKESHDCTGCEHLLYLWGMPNCCFEKWKGEKNMKRCELWKWASVDSNNAGIQPSPVGCRLE